MHFMLLHSTERKPGAEQECQRMKDPTQHPLPCELSLFLNTISSFKANPELDPATKQGELAILLIDIYRAVYVLSGGDSEWIHYFMNSYNEATKGVPIEQIQTISGLTTVLHFVDSVRAKM